MNAAPTVRLTVAQAVITYLSRQHSIPPARMQAVGKGGAEPLTKRPGESSRAYSARCQRVEFVLVSEN